MKKLFTMMCSIIGIMLLTVPTASAATTRFNDFEVFTDTPGSAYIVDEGVKYEITWAEDQSFFSYVTNNGNYIRVYEDHCEALAPAISMFNDFIIYYDVSGAEYIVDEGVEYEITWAEDGTYFSYVQANGTYVRVYEDHCEALAPAISMFNDFTIYADGSGSEYIVEAGTKYPISWDEDRSFFSYVTENGNYVRVYEDHCEVLAPAVALVNGVELYTFPDGQTYVYDEGVKCEAFVSEDGTLNYKNAAGCSITITADGEKEEIPPVTVADPYGNSVLLEESPNKILRLSFFGEVVLSVDPSFSSWDTAPTVRSQDSTAFICCGDSIMIPISEDGTVKVGDTEFSVTFLDRGRPEPTVSVTAVSLYIIY